MPTKKQERVIDTTATSDFEYLGFFIVDDDECRFRFGIEQTVYSLKTSHGNYNALYALLLGAWLNGYKVSVTYSTLRILDDGPFAVIAATAFPG